VSDDIVTRLRERALVLFCNGADGNAFIDEQAADEIEHLRAEISRLMQVICDSSPDDDYLLVRKESDAIWERIYRDNQAVRGE
jgi:hypothetical protein